MLLIRFVAINTKTPISDTSRGTDYAKLFNYILNSLINFNFIILPCVCNYLLSVSWIDTEDISRFSFFIYACDLGESVQLMKLSVFWTLLLESECVNFLKCVNSVVKFVIWLHHPIWNNSLTFMGIQSCWTGG
jgi:hypothetical protein